jgi:hypothetical protein
MSGSYQVAIWPYGPSGDEHPWGQLVYVETDRWCVLADRTPPCASDEQVIREARDAAKLLAIKAMSDDSCNWQPGSPNRDGTFERDGNSLVAPSRIEDLEIIRSSSGSV